MDTLIDFIPLAAICIIGIIVSSLKKGGARVAGNNNLHESSIFSWLDPHCVAKLETDNILYFP